MPSPETSSRLTIRYRIARRRAPIPQTFPPLPYSSLSLERCLSLCAREADTSRYLAYREREKKSSSTALVFDLDSWKGLEGRESWNGLHFPLEISVYSNGRLNREYPSPHTIWIEMQIKRVFPKREQKDRFLAWLTILLVFRRKSKNKKKIKIKKIKKKLVENIEACFSYNSLYVSTCMSRMNRFHGRSDRDPFPRVGENGSIITIARRNFVRSNKSVHWSERSRHTCKIQERERERESRGRKVCENVQPLSSPRSFEAGRDRRADRKVASGRSFFCFFPPVVVNCFECKNQGGRGRWAVMGVGCWLSTARTVFPSPLPAFLAHRHPLRGWPATFDELFHSPADERVCNSDREN